MIRTPGREMADGLNVASVADTDGDQHDGGSDLRQGRVGHGAMMPRRRAFSSAKAT